mmetsp:Transcript_91/g.207  ORF Transcript_91/g.207 Transcript_91/m.207 type:complete len:126 (-) Transcript_91:1127-1504(-)
MDSEATTQRSPGNRSNHPHEPQAEVFKQRTGFKLRRDRVTGVWCVSLSVSQLMNLLLKLLGNSEIDQLRWRLSTTPAEYLRAIFPANARNSPCMCLKILAWFPTGWCKDGKKSLALKSYCIAGIS